MPEGAPDSAARVARGAAAAAAAGAAMAVLRGAQPTRAGFAAALLATPFFALREAVVVGAKAEGPVASALAGGLAGYFGALALAGPNWTAVTRSAIVVGAGCGIVDALVTNLDWRRKMYIVSREDRAAASIGTASSASAAPISSVSAAASTSGVDPMLNASASGDARSTPRKAADGPAQWWARWPAWFPVLKEVDYEYEELLRKREALLAALEAEQTRIAALLEALEAVKARKQTLAGSSSDEAIGSSTAKEHVRTSRTMSDVTDPASPPGTPPSSP